jgi:DNA mismatch endonuclease (patch repair protein)
VLLRGPNFKAAQQRRPTRPFTVRPDFVFLKSRTVIFVDGCFWHGCPEHCNPMKWLKKSSMPANNPPSPQGRLRRTGRAFWQRKLSGNIKRDRLVVRTLRKSGWRVLRIWECDLQKCKVRGAKGKPPKLIQQIQRVLGLQRKLSPSAAK